MSAEVKIPLVLSRMRGTGLIAGIALLVLGLGLAMVIGENKSDTFFQGYLFAFYLWGGVSIGSVALLCIHHMTYGAWSFMIQRILEANVRMLPVIAIAFLPILAGPLLGLHGLYDAWVNPSADAEFAEVIGNKAVALQPGFWAARSVLYFAIWIGIGTLLTTWSRRMDDTGDGLVVLNFRRFCPPALIVYCLTMTFAALDWVMSLQPEWFSTLFGPLAWISQGLTILAFSILVLSYAADEKPLSRFVQAEHFHHLGNLMLAFTVLWAYMSFSQYLIIWSGNLPDEISYYMARKTNGYNALAVILMAGHFLFPLVYLLFRQNKLRLNRLRIICFWILAMRLFDVFWHMNPSFSHNSPGIDFTDVVIYLVVCAGFGGLWVHFFVGQLASRPLLSLNDPRLYEAVGLGADPEETLDHA